jgi:DNA-binding transcriptional ArsR family regulator
MTLEDKIQDRLVTDDESILESNLEAVEQLFQLHEDGTINIQPPYRGVSEKMRILIYFIGQRYAFEGGLADSDQLASEYFYKRIDKSDRTVRNYLQDLRDSGLVSKESQGSHRLIAENLPDALDRINAETD